MCNRFVMVVCRVCATQPTRKRNHQENKQLPENRVMHARERSPNSAQFHAAGRVISRLTLVPPTRYGSEAFSNRGGSGRATGGTLPNPNFARTIQLKWSGAKGNGAFPKPN